MESTRDGMVVNNGENNVLTKRIAWSCVFVALCGTWQYGFSVGAINAVRLPIKDAIQHDLHVRWEANVSEALVEGIWVANSAAFPTGGIVGAILVSVSARKFTTLSGLTVGHALTVIFSTLMALSSVIHSPELLVIGRFGVGITAALVGTGLSVIYVVEVSPQHVRGIFGTMIGMGISIGIAVSNILGHPEILGNDKFWPLLLALTGAPSLFVLVLKKTFVDTSRIKSPAKTELQPLQSLVREPQKPADVQKVTVKEVLCSHSLRRQLTCAVALCASQQLTGLNGVSFNMNQIYLRAGIPSGYVHYVSIGVTTAVIFLNLISACVTDKYGRKSLLQFGFALEGISLLLLVASIESQHLSDAMAYVSIVASFGFWVGFSLGPGPLTLATAVEFFDLSTRSAGMTVATVALWVSFVATVVATPYLLASIKGYAFLPFGIMAFLSLVFVRYYVPETKNKSFSEIQESFLRKKADDGS